MVHYYNTINRILELTILVICTPPDIRRYFSTSASVVHKMKIYLDDERETPDGWVRCYWPDEVIAILQGEAVAEVSLDHDLGDDDRGTGYDVLLWIEEAVVTAGFVPPLLRVHSANTSARIKMEAAIRTIDQLHQKNLSPSAE